MLMGLVKTRRLAAMHPPSPRLRRAGRQQRAIHLRQGYGGLKAGMKPPVGNIPREISGKGTKVSATMKYG